MSKIKRGSEGKCNICGKLSKLTWDHVPPRGCHNKDAVICRNLFSEIDVKNERYEIHQNGMRFRSLCGCCNNLLGHEYDLEAKIFIDNSLSLINSKQILPEMFEIETRINRLCRSVCGHLLAAKKDYDNQTVTDIFLREYLLNQTQTRPENMRLLIRIYPFNGVIIARDVVTSGRDTTMFPDGMISVISSYPYAYILTNGQNKCNLVDLFDYCDDNIDNEVNIPIHRSSLIFPGTNRLRHPKWPLNIGNDNESATFVLVGENGNNAINAYSKQSMH